MSDLSVTEHNLGDLLTGKTDFNGFVAGEVAIFKKDVAKLPVTAQAFVGASISSLETSASGLVGVGKTVLGPIIAANTDDQSTMVLNLLQAAGVPTQGRDPQRGGARRPGRHHQRPEGWPGSNRDQGGDCWRAACRDRARAGASAYHLT